MVVHSGNRLWIHCMVQDNVVLHQSAKVTLAGPPHWDNGEERAISCGAAISRLDTLCGTNYALISDHLTNQAWALLAQPKNIMKHITYCTA